MHLAESSSTLFCLWTGLSLPVALHPASQRRSYLQLRTGQCSRPEGTFTLLLVRTFRRTFPRHFVPGYDRTVPPGQKPLASRGPYVKLALMGFLTREPPAQRVALKGRKRCRVSPGHSISSNHQMFTMFSEKYLKLLAVQRTMCSNARHAKT